MVKLLAGQGVQELPEVEYVLVGHAVESQMEWRAGV